MKPRHAAALALVGWYLMMPPHGPTKCSNPNPLGWSESGNVVQCQARIESQAPFRQWKRVPDSQEFEHKMDCERAISNDCASSLQGDLCIAKAECIATDDPRLKEK
jgi:hypothetical protein